VHIFADSLINHGSGFLVDVENKVVCKFNELSKEDPVRDSF